jgi:hypothetical protein
MSTEMLHCFPQDDPSFRAAAEALVTSSASDDPRELERELRRTYPKAVVRRQHPLGSLSDAARIWYVYRDGHYMTPSDAEEIAAPVDAA